jgi:hypothetical protein
MRWVIEAAVVAGVLSWAATHGGPALPPAVPDLPPSITQDDLRQIGSDFAPVPRRDGESVEQWCRSERDRYAQLGADVSDMSCTGPDGREYLHPPVSDTS